MNKILSRAFMMSAVVLASHAAAAPIIKPVADKYYRVRHVSGLYLTDDGFNSRICDRVEDNTQIVQFLPVESKDGVYNIKRVSSGMLCGTDNRWASTAISRNVPQSQYRIALSDNVDYIVFLSESMSEGKNCMGSDDTVTGSEVYTDKNGKDAQKHLWVIEEADVYPIDTERLPDCYPDKQLSADDPRANAYEGYKLVFAQEFSDDQLSSDVWSFEEGFCRNKEDQWYNGGKNIYVQDGVLVIEGCNVESEKIKNPKYNQSDGSWPSNIGEYLTWTSGSMMTRGGDDGGYNWLYGIYEVRAKVPQYVGAWPAIWSTGAEHEWPYGGEIDIMEYYGNCIHGNVCWGNGHKWGATWNSAVVHDDDLGERWGDDYHIWRMLWDYDHIELWCDDILVNNINLDTTYNAITAGDYDYGNGCNPFRDVRQMLWLNLALGGQNGGSLADTPRPLRYLVDYARVYQKIGTDGKAKYLVDDKISEPTFSIKDGEENVAKVNPGGTATVNRLFCKGLENPIGVSGSPVFGWQIDSDAKNYIQSAYEIELSANPGFRDKMVWRSDKIKSDNSISVKYTGEALKPAMRYYWRVKVWDTNGESTDWSHASSFVTGVADPSQWRGAEWIAMEHDRNSVVPFLHAPDVWNAVGDRKIGDYKLPIMRKSFKVERPVKSAVAFVCGLGQFECFLNGKKVGDHFLDPGWTFYDKEAEYVGFDITDMIIGGDNTVGVMLGNGMYNIPRERYYKIVGSYGAPKLKALLVIEYEDGVQETIVTDSSWLTREGPVTFSSIFGGEDYDAAKLPENWCGSQDSGTNSNISDAGWDKVIITNGPELLKSQLGTALKVKERFAPQRLLIDSDGKSVYDFGQNISGIVGLKIKGEPGQTVRLRPAELIDEGNHVNQSASGEPYYFTYTVKGDSVEYWQPQFSYYGFRYVQLDTVNCGGVMPEVELTLLHTTADNRETGYFRSSDALLNDVYNLIDRAMASNTASVLTDCPHREKLGWLEQAHLMQNSLMSRRDMRHIYRKAMADMAASQLENGCIPTIAPEYVRFAGGFEDSPEWGSAFIQCPYRVWIQYGDEDILSEYYLQMKKFMEYLGSRADNHIVAYGLGDWYDIGPDNPGYSQLTSLGVTGTAMYYQNALAMSTIAKVLGKNSDSEAYSKLASEIRDAFNLQFYKPMEGYYDRNSQTANAMALALGLVEEGNRHKVEKALADDISAKGLTAGDIGYWYVIKALEGADLSELLYNLNKRYDTPGYGWQLAHGATCLTESWQAYGFVSNNHMMLGHLMEWLFSGLAGISADWVEGSRHLIIAPQPVGDVSHAEARIETPYGEASSRWERQGDNIRLLVEIPANSYATVKLPDGSHKIGSGRHCFEYVIPRFRL